MPPSGNVYASIQSGHGSQRDLNLDSKLGFTIIPASDILKNSGVWGILKQIRGNLPQNSKQPVYVSLDVNVLDPAFALGTAGPSNGGWTPENHSDYY